MKQAKQKQGQRQDNKKEGGGEVGGTARHGSYVGL